MGQSEILDVFREMLMLILGLSGPLLLTSISIGLLVSIFQAATQINEQTLTFVPKVLCIGFLLLVLGSSMMARLISFFNYIVDIMIRL